MTCIVANLALYHRYLHDHVAEQSRALVMSGHLPPLSRVNGLKLSERFGNSRTPLREAIKVVATEGLLHLLPNSGARLAHLSATEIEDVLAVIAGLEGTAAELACARITEAAFEAIAADHAAMMAAGRSADEAVYFVHNQVIDDGLTRAARINTLSDVYANLTGRMARARYIAQRTPRSGARLSKSMSARLFCCDAGAAPNWRGSCAPVLTARNP